MLSELGISRVVVVEPMDQIPEEAFAADGYGGGYFVSNYPPFSHWTDDAVISTPASLQVSQPSTRPLGVYVHIPFCRKRCHFCYFRVYTGYNAQMVEDYLGSVVQEVALLREQPALTNRTPDFLYFGGGTPSYLSARQFDGFIGALQPLLDLSSLKEFTFECEPGTLNLDKLQAFRAAGVGRLSLGVEHFDSQILEVNGRAHDHDDIYEAYELARKIGFPQINIDLISGLLGDTEETWKDSVRRTVELNPDSVTIYQLELPYNTTFHRESRESERDLAELPDWPTKRRWTQAAFDQLEAAGYELSSGYTAARDAATFVYRDSLWEGADLLGVGVSAFSKMGDTHYQNDKHIDGYQTRIKAGVLPIMRGYVMNADEQLIRQVVLQLKRGHLDRAAFLAGHGVDIGQRFAGPIKRLERFGLAQVDDRGVQLSRQALLQVDRLLPWFFRPEHNQDRQSD